MHKGFHLSLPIGARMVGFDLDGWLDLGIHSGLTTVNGKQAPEVPGSPHGQQVQDAEPHELEVTVRLDGANAWITTALDTRPLYEWIGPVTALDQSAKWRAISPPGTFTLGAHADDCVVFELKAKRLGPSAPASAAVARPASAPDGWADLLTPLTPAFVEKTGHGWRMNAGTLVSPSVPYAMLPLPGTFSGTSYQVRVKLKQRTAKNGFHLVLPVGDRMTGFELDSWSGKYTGLNSVNGKLSKDVPGVVQGKQVKDSEPHDLEVTVRLDGTNATITTTLDTHPLYEWTGPAAALSQQTGWATTPPGSLALGTMADDWVVSEVKAKRLEEK